MAKNTERQQAEEMEVAKGISPYKSKERYPGQTKPLPSEEASESNKERQDAAAKEFARQVARSVIGGPAGISDYIGAGIAGRYKKGGKVKSASARADGCAQRGKTRGKIV